MNCFLSKQNWIRLWLISLLLIAPGCGESPGANEDTDLIVIEEGIHFTVTETHDQSHKVNTPVEPFIQLKLETEDIYSCVNYRLISNFSPSQSDMQVEILGVKKPAGACLTALGTALNRFQLDVTPGEYKLVFKYNGTTYPYQLMVTDSSLQIYKPSGDILNIPLPISASQPPIPVGCAKSSSKY